jgi:hypothetical protein
MAGTSLLDIWRSNRATNKQARELGAPKAYKHPFMKAVKVWFWFKTGNPEMAAHELRSE